MIFFFIEETKLSDFPIEEMKLSDYPLLFLIKYTKQITLLQKQKIIIIKICNKNLILSIAKFESFVFLIKKNLTFFIHLIEK